MKKKHELTIEAGRLQKHRRTFEERVRMLHSDKNDFQTPVADVLHALRKNAEREKRDREAKREIETDIQFHEEQVLELEQEIRYFQAQIEQLFTEAGAKTEMSFSP